LVPPQRFPCSRPGGSCAWVSPYSEQPLLLEPQPLKLSGLLTLLPRVLTAVLYFIIVPGFSSSCPFFFGSLPYVFLYLGSVISCEYKNALPVAFLLTLLILSGSSQLGFISPSSVLDFAAVNVPPLCVRVPAGHFLRRLVVTCYRPFSPLFVLCLQLLEPSDSFSLHGAPGPHILSAAVPVSHEGIPWIPCH